MLKEQVKHLPTQPGVYLLYDSEDQVIYVGKAKVLKNRVSQYFQNNSNHSPKVRAMVANVTRFEYIITQTELEALVLECNLIKQHRPKYNILLKDDKNYPYIKLTVNEPFPRIFLARRMENDGAKYFGPYISAMAVRETIDLLKKIFCVRSCTRVLPRDIGKARPCLNYDIKKCSAPCAGFISQEDYRKDFDGIVAFLQGDHDAVTRQLMVEMEQAAANLEFERAAKARDKLNAIRRLGEKQRVVATHQGNQDAIALVQDGLHTCIQIFYIRSGKVVGRDHYFLKSDQQDTPSQMMTDFVKQYYGMATNIPKNILLHHDVEDKKLLEQWLSEKSGGKIELLVPKRGEKHHIIKMVEQNAIETLKLELIKRDVGRKKRDSLMLELTELLGLKKAPNRIEAYDISNTSGADSVGVCVVFEDGKPQKSSYKKFNIRSTETPDDYQSMKEVLYRRLSNGVEGEAGFVPLPDLILIDGGKGHVSSVQQVVQFFKLDIPVFGLVKDDKHRTRGVTTETDEIDVKRTSNVFHFFTAMQDEVHRYAVGAHRKKRSKSALASSLEDIPGVGEKRRTALLKHFKSVSAIQTASLEQLQAAPKIDRKTAKAVYDHYHPDEREQ